MGSLGIGLRLGGSLCLGVLSGDCVVVGLNASSSLVNAGLGLLLASLVGSLQVGDLLGILSLILHFLVVGFGLGGGSHRQP